MHDEVFEEDAWCGLVSNGFLQRFDAMIFYVICRSIQDTWILLLKETCLRIMKWGRDKLLNRQV